MTHQFVVISGVIYVPLNKKKPTPDTLLDPKRFMGQKLVIPKRKK